MNAPRAQSRRRLLGAILAGLLMIASAAPAAAHGPDPVFGGGPFGQNEVLGFAWRAGGSPPIAIRRAILAGAQDVADSRASKAAIFRYTAVGRNRIGYGADATCGPNGIACFTRSAPHSFTMWLREQGHVFDWGPLKWCQMYSSAPNGCYDVENIALDEFGHVEMLGHHLNHANASDYRDAVVQTLSRTRPNSGYNAHAFGRCDVASLQREYDMLSWTARYSTCLNLATTLELGASATSIRYGGSLTLTASLKVRDQDAYRRLGGNPLAGRTVWLQYRPVGASVWISAGSMSAGATAGTYRLGQNPRWDRQYRAVFADPPTEGLGGANSTAITVRVGSCSFAACPVAGPVPVSGGHRQRFKEGER